MCPTPVACLVAYLVAKLSDACFSILERQIGLSNTYGIDYYILAECFKRTSKCGRLDNVFSEVPGRNPRCPENHIRPLRRATQFDLDGVLIGVAMTVAHEVSGAHLMLYVMRSCQ